MATHEKSLSDASDTFSVVQALLKLYTAFDQCVKGLTKHSRYTLGTKISNEILDVLELTLLAISKTERSRLALLSKIDTRLQLLKLMIRLLYSTQGITEKTYVRFSESIVTLSRMNGGWLAATKRKQQGEKP